MNYFVYVFFFFFQEERFLFPVYPLISLASSTVLEYFRDLHFHSNLVHRFSVLKLFNKLLNIAYIPLLFIFVLLGVSRSTLLVKG